LSVRDKMGEVCGEHGVQRIDAVASRTAPTTSCPRRALGVEGHMSATCSTGWIVAGPFGSSAVSFTASEISCGASTGSIRREKGKSSLARWGETERDRPRPNASACELTAGISFSWPLAPSACMAGRRRRRLRLCSFPPTPGGIRAKSPCVSRDQIRGGLIPAFSYHAFG
jgi:hypothetical protein